MTETCQINFKSTQRHGSCDYETCEPMTVFVINNISFREIFNVDFFDKNNLMQLIFLQPKKMYPSYQNNSYAYMYARVFF